MSGTFEGDGPGSDGLGRGETVGRQAGTTGHWHGQGSRRLVCGQYLGTRTQRGRPRQTRPPAPEPLYPSHSVAALFAPTAARRGPGLGCRNRDRWQSLQTEAVKSRRESCFKNPVATGPGSQPPSTRKRFQDRDCFCTAGYDTPRRRSPQPGRSDPRRRRAPAPSRYVRVIAPSRYVRVIARWAGRAWGRGAAAG